MRPDTREAQLLLLEMSLREAKRRTKKAKPPASALVAVLDDLGFKLQATWNERHGIGDPSEERKP